MPVNVSATGMAPAVLPAQEPSSPHGGSSVAPQRGSAAELRSRNAPGDASPLPRGRGDAACPSQRGSERDH